MFNIDRGLVESASCASDLSSGAPSLPIPYLRIWWKNGNLSLHADNGVEYHGGWYAQEEDYVKAVEEIGSDPVSFREQVFTNRTGGKYKVYTSRSIAIAPIVSRTGWFKSESGRPFSSYNLLCYMAEWDKQNRKYSPWGHVLLCSTSHSGVAIQRAISAFESISSDARRQHANGYPIGLFYFPVGSFGDEPVTEEKKNKKNPQQSSIITPCKLYPFTDISKEQLERWFVGEAIASVMSETKRLAQDWVKHWDRYNGKGKQQQTTIEQDAASLDDALF